MKKLLYVITALTIGTLTIANAQNVKVKTIKYGSDAYYTGEVVKKSPMGKGSLYLTSYSPDRSEYREYSLEGRFNGETATDATLVFEKYNLAFKGEVSYTEEKGVMCREFNFTLKNGSFYSLPENRQLGIVGTDGLNIQINAGYKFFVSGNGEVEKVPTINQTKLDYMTEFAQSESYTVKGYPAEFFIDNDDYGFRTKLGQSESWKLTFDNGATIEKNATQEIWKRPNGDYMNIDNLMLVTTVQKYKLTFGNDYIENNKVFHKFSNGNTFNGTVTESLILADGSDDKTFSCSDLDKLLEIVSIDWDWKDVLKYAKDGVLTYSDGEYYKGVLNADKEDISGDKLPESAYFTGTLYNADNTKIQTYVMGMDETQYAEYQKKQEEERQKREAEYAKEKATDYFKFDDYGNICEFKITYPDLTKFIYRYDEKTNKVLENTIYYPNGDVLDDPYLCGSFYEYQGKFTNSMYKDIIPKNESPYILDPDLPGKRIFKDGLSIALIISKRWYNGPTDYEYIIKQTEENGDYSIIGTKKLVDNNNKNNNEIYSSQLYEFQKTFNNDYKALSKKIDYNHNDANNYYWSPDGKIYYKSGNVFVGSYSISCKTDHTLYEDPRIIALGAPVGISYESIEKITPYYGRVISPSGKILEIYREGKKLDDFDFAQAIAEEEGELRLEQEKLERQKQGLLEAESKYGKKNVDALMNGKIIIGMPEDLLIGGVNYHILPYLSISLSIDHGSSKCYDLWKIGSDGNIFDPDYAGYVWVTDGKVSSIHL